jgi:hypothetical protein
MNDIHKRIEAVNWPSISEAMNANGYAIIPGLIAPDECNTLIQNYGNASSYRKTVVMERYRFGHRSYRN